MQACCSNELGRYEGVLTITVHDTDCLLQITTLWIITFCHTTWSDNCKCTFIILKSLIILISYYEIPGPNIFVALRGCMYCIYRFINEILVKLGHKHIKEVNPVMIVIALC